MGKGSASCFGVPIVRILLFRVLNLRPLFSETPGCHPALSPHKAQIGLVPRPDLKPADTNSQNLEVASLL